MVPLAIGVWEVTGWIRYQYPGEVLRVSLVDNFLTANCGSSECLYELGITAPLVSSLAFAVGAELRWIVVQKKARVHPSVH